MSTNHNIRLNNSEKSAMHVHYYPEIVRSIIPFPIPLSSTDALVTSPKTRSMHNGNIPKWDH